jgi:ADP-ribosylglycohydrolase
LGRSQQARWRSAFGTKEIALGKHSNALYDRVLGCLLGGEIGDAMGAPAEGKTYLQVAEEFGEITNFSGHGTDDSALKHILCDAIFAADGYPTADDWAAAWLRHEDLFINRRLFWTPVMNGFWKVRAEGALPRDAGRGNMASSSSAMCISPVGIINAGNPRQAALEAFDLASIIHHNFCRDAACAMAAAVAQALAPQATTEGVLDAAISYLPPQSGVVMRSFIVETLDLAREAGGYERFRERYYAERLLPGIAIADSRETVPVALALFCLAEGDPRKTIIYGANFGRDADTIGSMAGAIAGALHGAAALPAEWIEQARVGSSWSNAETAARLIEVIERRVSDAKAWTARLQAMSQNSLATTLRTGQGGP